MAGTFVSPEVLLDHWLGHRNLTRRTIEAFPEDKLFSFSIGGMRTFGEIGSEIASMGGAMARGLVDLTWDYDGSKPTTKAELLAALDKDTALIKEHFLSIPESRFEEEVTSFGQYTGPGHWQVLYVIDNEIHHRGQGYVYLRALEIEPPPFWERGSA